MMPHLTRAGCTVAAAIVAVLISGPAVRGQQRDSTGGQDQRESPEKKPSLSLRVSPPLGFSPLRVHAVAELRGGPDDYEDFYCAAVEWDWGDGTVSENSTDCDPYQAGKSEIQRRFSTYHTFRQGASYRVAFRLRQKSRVVASTAAGVEVRPGARDGFEE